MCLTLCCDMLACMCRCCGSDCCTETCLNCLGECCGIPRAKIVRMAYILFNFIMIVFALIFLYLAQQALAPFSMFLHCPQNSGGSLVCLGASAVYRLSLAMIILYISTALFVKCVPKTTRPWVEGAWVGKSFVVICLFIGLLFVPNQFSTNIFKYICAVFALIFMLVMSVHLIDVFYKISIRWKTAYDQGRTEYGCLLIAASLLFYAIAITLNVLVYVQFTCLTWLGIINSLLIVIVTIVQLIGLHQQGSLLATGMTSAFFSFMAFSASLSLDNSHCNPYFYSQEGMLLELAIQMPLLCIVLFKLVNEVESDDTDETNLMNATEEGDREEDRQNKFVRKQKEWLIWFLLMALCWTFLPMILTNWGSPALSNSTLDTFKPNRMAFIIKLIYGVLTGVVYGWTLIAPRVFPDRDFY